MCSINNINIASYVVLIDCMKEWGSYVFFCFCFCLVLFLLLLLQLFHLVMYAVNISIQEGGEVKVYTNVCRRGNSTVVD
jgi:hypothetical protein